jgi:hypothetical protein
MTIEQTVELPASHRLTIEVPRIIPAGRVILTFTPAPPVLSAANTLSRIGFLSGQISIPPDFDTMGREEIAVLFGENP